MTKMLKNLTLPAVVEVVESVLDTYPDHPYQQAFANPDTRQHLLAFTLERVKNSYDVVEEPEHAPDLVSFSSEERWSVEAVIHEGIHCILEDSCDTIQHQVPEEEQPGLVASHWFG